MPGGDGASDLVLQLWVAALGHAEPLDLDGHPVDAREEVVLRIAQHSMA